MLCDTKHNIHFLVSYKCFKDRTLLYNACSTHMHTIMMLMRCFGKTIQCNTEGVTISTAHTCIRNNHHDRECRHHCNCLNVIAEVILSPSHSKPHLQHPRQQPFHCILPFWSLRLSLSQNSLQAHLVERTLHHMCWGLCCSYSSNSIYIN